MKTLKLTPAVTNKPCDIEYRLKRAHALAFECRQFLESIDTSTAIGINLQHTQEVARSLEASVAELRTAAPQKRVHLKREDKPAAPPKVPGRRGRPRKVRPEAAAPEAVAEVQPEATAAAAE